MIYLSINYIDENGVRQIFSDIKTNIDNINSTAVSAYNLANIANNTAYLAQIRANRAYEQANSAQVTADWGYSNAILARQEVNNVYNVVNNLIDNSNTDTTDTDDYYMFDPRMYELWTGSSISIEYDEITFSDYSNLFNNIFRDYEYSNKIKEIQSKGKRLLFITTNNAFVLETNKFYLDTEGLQFITKRSINNRENPWGASGEPFTKQIGELNISNNIINNVYSRGHNSLLNIFPNMLDKITDMSDVFHANSDYNSISLNRFIIPDYCCNFAYAYANTRLDYSAYVYKPNDGHNGLDFTKSKITDYDSINVYGMFEGRGHLSYFQEMNTVIKATYKTPFWDCIMNNFDIFGRNEPLIWDYDYELYLSDGIHRCKQNRYSGLVFLNYYDNQQ